MNAQAPEMHENADVVKGSRRKGPRLLSLICSLLLTFLLLEIGMRVWITNFAGERRFLKYASLRQLEKKYRDVKPRWTVHRYLGHYSSPGFRKGENRHNSLGYRSDEIALPKPAGQFRIVCLGGSTTYTTGVKDYRLSYPNLLETELRRRGYQDVNVVNAGVGAYTSWESLISFELRVLDLEPDMIIIYHAVNDILSRLVWPPEAYLGDNSGQVRPIAMSMPSIVEYSTLIRYFMIRTGIVKPHSTLDRSLIKPPEVSYAAEFLNQKYKNTYPTGIFKQVSAREMLAANGPRYFERNIENIMAIANHRGIKTVIATFASSPLFTDNPCAASEEFLSAFDEMNAVLKSICEKTGGSLFDFAGSFPEDKSYYTDGIHVSIKGARLKANLFADYLIENKLLPAPEDRP